MSILEFEFEGLLSFKLQEQESETIDSLCEMVGLPQIYLTPCFSFRSITHGVESLSITCRCRSDAADELECLCAVSSERLRAGTQDGLKEMGS